MGITLAKATAGELQKSPILIPGTAKVALELAIAKSHAATNWQPAAVA